MTKATRLPSALYRLTWLALLGLPAALAYVAATGRLGRDALAAEFPLEVGAAALTDGQVIGAAVVGLLPWLVVMWVLWRTQGLLDLYRNGQALTAAAAGHIRALGLGLAILGVLKVLVHSAQTVIVTAANPPGTRALEIMVGSGEIGFLLAGGLMLTIGHSMAEAVRAADDLRGFV